jgi:hypothetical protein
VPGVQTLKVVHASSVTWVARLASRFVAEAATSRPLLLRPRPSPKEKSHHAVDARAGWLGVRESRPLPPPGLLQV